MFGTFAPVDRHCLWFLYCAADMSLAEIEQFTGWSRVSILGGIATWRLDEEIAQVDRTIWHAIEERHLDQLLDRRVADPFRLGHDLAAMSLQAKQDVRLALRLGDLRLEEIEARDATSAGQLIARYAELPVWSDVKGAS